METPSPTPSPSLKADLWKTLPEKLALMSVHHLARLLVLFRDAQPSQFGSTEMILDMMLINLDLARLTRDSRKGWSRVELTPEGDSLAVHLIEMALGPAHSSSPTPSEPPARLSLVYRRAAS